MVPRHVAAGRFRHAVLAAAACAGLLSLVPPAAADASRPALPAVADGSRPGAAAPTDGTSRSTADRGPRRAVTAVPTSATRPDRPAVVRAGARPRAARVGDAVRWVPGGRAGTSIGSRLLGAAVTPTPIPPSTPGTARGKTYVAFGDSYSSGPGLQPAREPGCGRSAANWASDVARTFGLGDERRGDWADYSCAGATAGRAPGGPATTLQDQVGWAARDGALGPGTDAVTFTAGGNDGWAGKDHDALYDVLRSCVAAGVPCGPGRRVGPVGRLLPEQLTGLLPAGLAELLGSVLAGDDERDRWLAPDDLSTARAEARLRPAVDAIRRRAPRATIAVVGYPRVVPPAGSPGCAGPVGLGWGLERGEVTYLDGLLAAYDRVQRAAVAELDRDAGPVRHVDLRTPSTGHDVCAGPDAWVNAPILAGLGFGGDSLHPSVGGMDRIAGVVAAFARATGLTPAR